MFLFLVDTYSKFLLCEWENVKYNFENILIVLPYLSTLPFQKAKEKEILEL